MKKVLFALFSTCILTAGGAAVANEAIQINGDYRFRFDSLRGTVHEYVQADPSGATPAGFAVPGYDVKNDALLTNRFGLDLRSTPLEDISVKARLVMYKVWGHETSTPVNGSFFGDRAMGANDGTVGHFPQDNTLRVDSAYATWSNIGQAPVWFSIGRRPSTGGIPSNYRDNREKIGTAGIPSLMVDYAFDGATVGYAPDIAALPGAYAKLCYGKGFDSGYVRTTGTTLKDTDFLGLNAAFYDSENLHVELQYQKGWNIFDAPSDGSALTGPVQRNLGDIDWVGGIVTGKVENLHLFFSAAQSKTEPNDNTFGANTSPWGLLWTSAAAGGSGKESATGTAFYVGGRYDIVSTGTKIGAEYNQGSKNWVGMVPAGDDIWTSKLGTRGSVYEVYIIQELPNKPLTDKAKAFFKLGYQAYTFDYTGSNNWIGAPVKISDLSTANPATQQMLAPIETATDIYLTFDVRF